MNFILSQCFGLVALILVCISYLLGSKKNFLAFQIIANLFYALSFLTLNVMVGGANTIISIARVTVLYFFEKSDKEAPIWLFVIFSMLYLLSGNCFYQNDLDILAVVAYEFFNMAMFIRDIELTRIMMIFPNLLIVIYNFLNFTFTNSILDLVEIIVLLVVTIRCALQKRRSQVKYLIWFEIIEP